MTGRLYGANQKVSVEEAIEVFTLGGAYASFEEKIKGSITPGKLADFVVLRTDPRPGRAGGDQGHRARSDVHRGKAGFFSGRDIGSSVIPQPSGRGVKRVPWQSL
jgi:hypothetical protein